MGQTVLEKTGVDAEVGPARPRTGICTCFHTGNFTGKPDPTPRNVATAPGFTFSKDLRRS